LKTLFIDNISLLVFLKLLFQVNKNTEIRVLNDQVSYKLFLYNVLKALRFSINTESFFLGDIKDSNGESLHIVSRKKASKLALNFSKWIMINNKVYNSGLECSESKRIIELFISKRTMLEFEYYTQRIEYIIITKKGNDPLNLWIQDSLLINHKFIYDSYKQIDLAIIKSFKKQFTFRILRITKGFFKNLFSFFYEFQKIGFKSNEYPILALPSDAINLNTNHRHFPHWVTNENEDPTLIINRERHKIDLSVDNLLNLKFSIIKDVPYSLSSIFTKRIIKVDSKDFLVDLKSQIYDLLSLSQRSYYFLGKIKCKKFIYLEPQDPITDAIQLVSNNLKIKTICIQYANLGLTSPMMIPSCDNFLVFSKMYEKVYKWKDLGPKRFTEVGYSFIYNIENLDNFNFNKQNFVISYFDESVQNYKWGFHSEKHNQEIIESLADLVIKNQDVSVVLKPQFINNSISRINSKVIDIALSTGRFHEAIEGEKRNLITPSQMAEISNLSIAHIGGGTAALEIALKNKRVVLINEGGYITEFDELYNKSNINFNSIDEIINQIDTKHKRNNISIGDWSNIIDDFSVNHLKSKELINHFLKI
tara:strand:- start:4598 stop:6370 length:1773 start_codon:yes stop_codon:yes gene_type:complete